MEAFKRITTKIQLSNAGYRALNQTLKGKASIVYAQVNELIENEKNAGFRQKYRRCLALIAILSFFIALSAGAVGFKRWGNVKKGAHEPDFPPSHHASAMRKEGLTDSVWMNGPMVRRKARNVVYDDQLKKCVLKVRQGYKKFSQDFNNDTVHVTVKETKGYKIVGVICSTLHGLEYNMKYSKKRKSYSCICKGRNTEEQEYIKEKLKTERNKEVFRSTKNKVQGHLTKYLACFANYLICPTRK